MRYHAETKRALTFTQYNDIMGDDGYGGSKNARDYDLLPEIIIPYDSTADTQKHIRRVSQLLNEAAIELIKRANVHDNSKLESPEKEGFDEWTPKLAGSTYGSDEYKGYLVGMQEVLKHHYANNSHHPEHYQNGIEDFDLFDLVEMFFDWKAATERHKDGDIMKSIAINMGRFDMSDQLAAIFQNTARNLFKQ